MGNCIWSEASAMYIANMHLRDRQNLASYIAEFVLATQGWMAVFEVQ